jgi:hypothetical protein
MVERINRRGVERIYQPRIHSTLIHEIYRVGELTGLPMTVIIDHAIRENLAKYETASGQSEQPDIKANEGNT